MASQIHMAFDLLAVFLAMLSGGVMILWRYRTALEKTAASVGQRYFIAMAAGSLIGSFGLGTANLYLSGEQIIGRSILGTLFGAILAIEIYKYFKHVKGSTGYIYIIPFCILVVVGRIGCYISGLEDHTYGIPTTLPWGQNFGDGVPRHPVQLYESFSMLGFAALTVILLALRPQIIIAYGFYLCVGFYAAQRFIWEFLKPYGTVFSGMNLFHIICLILILYSFIMIIRVRNGYRTA